MGSKTRSTTNQRQDQRYLFDPGSQGVYNSLQGPLGNVLLDYMKDPLKASYFTQMLGAGNRQISTLGGRRMGNLMQNQAVLGALNPSQRAELAGGIGRDTSRMQSENFTNLLLNAEQTRRAATGAAMGYQPLTTGQTGTSSGTSTQETSGLGTWLPQLIGTLGGAALGAFGGGPASQPFSPSAAMSPVGIPQTSPFFGGSTLGQWGGQFRPNPRSY